MDLERFVTEVLLRSPTMPRLTAGAAIRSDPNSLTISVRRGDYYDNPSSEALFGFDLVSYIRNAVIEVMRDAGYLESVLVVSDGPDWCRDKLSWLQKIAPLRFEGPEAGVLGNFASLAGSRRLILSNSTFSYWAAYVSNVLHGDNHHQVWVPCFHSRAINEGRPWQHDPRWRSLSVYF